MIVVFFKGFAVAEGMFPAVQMTKLELRGSAENLQLIKGLTLCLTTGVHRLLL